VKIDIGGGTVPAPGYLNVDPVHGDSVRVRSGYDVRDLKVRVQDGIPLEAGSVEAARASHVLEHVPKEGGQLLAAMNEVWRVLRPGGEFETIVPCAGFTSEHVPDEQRSPVQRQAVGPVYNGWQPWADPTHVSFWWYPESWWYFTGGPGGAFRANADYGIRYWEWGDGRLVDGWEAHVTLVKPR